LFVLKTNSLCLTKFASSLTFLLSSKNFVEVLTMSVKKIKPLGSRVLVKRSEAKTTKGGIILPDSAKEKPRQGEVIAAGPGKRDDEGAIQAMNVKVGDRVLFSAYAGTEVKTEAQEAEYLILAEEDILGVLV
jgi:chaperonin GroES